MTNQEHKEILKDNEHIKANGVNILVVIASLMVTTYLTANIMAVKLISICGVTLFDAGTVVFPIAFMLGNVLVEIWGFKTSKRIIFLTFGCMLFSVLATTIGIILPYPDYVTQTAKSYENIFTIVPRILIASLVAFLVGELVNAYAMEKIKIKTNGKHLWVRTISSSAVGYAFDTIIFVLIAFSGTSPIKDLITMIIAQYIIKLFIEILAGTPFAYAFIAYIKRKEHKYE